MTTEIRGTGSYKETNPAKRESSHIGARRTASEGIIASARNEKTSFEVQRATMLSLYVEV